MKSSSHQVGLALFLVKLEIINMGLLLTYLSATLNSSWLWMVVLAIALYWAYMRVFVAYFDTSIDRTDEKTFLVTGAETGIGREISDLLASRGGRIIMACKDVNMGQAAREQIVKRTHNERVEVRHLDLSSLQSIRQFSKQIHSCTEKLDVLIHNAAVSCAASDKTADGLNTIMQVNHFGPFLLNNLLLDLVKKAAPSRIVFVSCVSHHFHKFSLDNLNCEQETLPACRLYFNSKLANILTAKYFARILQGTGVCVNSVHPGFVNTNLTSNCSGSVLGMLYNLWISIFGRIPREGAMTPVYAATEPKLTYVTGEHISECKVSTCVANIAKDTIVQERLFEKSSQLVKLRPEETHI